jgi:hypothetical protein
MCANLVAAGHMVTAGDARAELERAVMQCGVQWRATLPAATSGGYLRDSGQVVVEGNALPCRVLAGSPPHPQGGQDEGGEEDNDADDQQVQQTFGDHADEAQRDRCDY